MEEVKPDKIPKFIRRYMPDATEGELRDATATFRQYVAIVMRMHERIRAENFSDSRDSDSQGRVGDVPKPV